MHNFWLGLWGTVSLLGIWICIGVIYRNSKKNTRQMEKIIELLEQIKCASMKGKS
jgi:hypothetical protein